MKMNSKLILICGLPGSGKTTLARKLELETPAIRFCPDDWMNAFSLNLWDEDRRAKIESFQWDLAKKLLMQGTSVIVEWGTWAKSEREILRQEAQALGAITELHYLSATADILFARIQARNQEDPPIQRSDVEKWMRVFQVPSADELKLYDFTSISEQTL